MAYFTVVPQKEGMGKITVTASGNGVNSKSVTSLEAVDRSVPVTVSQSFVLKAGESRKVKFALAGRAGTNKAAVEVSTIPSINLKKRLSYLTEYPHGCLEQTVSSAFPQLYIGSLADCGPDLPLACENNVKSALRRLASFKNGDGSMSYWPGVYGISEWGTAYASHFMIEARKCGYTIDEPMLADALKYLKKNVYRSIDPLTKAYFLYVLAIGRQFQNGAMNNMRETISEYDARTRWMLAAAYAQDGEISVAKEIIDGIPSAPSAPDGGSTFGSADRDKAVVALAYLKSKDFVNAFSAVRSLALSLNDGDRFMSTQSTAWALCAVGSYVSSRNSGGGIDAAVTAAGKKYDVKSDKSASMREIALAGDETSVDVEVKNNGGDQCYVLLSSDGTPAAGHEPATSNGLAVSITYKKDGVQFSPVQVGQGTDFSVVATVRNTSVDAVRNVVLSTVFASGWEIVNSRLYDAGYACPPGVSYQDFRDDRVYSYMDYLAPGASVTVPLRLTATYEGSFYMPAVKAEAMYDDRISASVAGFRTEVVRAY